MTLDKALRVGARRLEAAGIAGSDARPILAHVLGVGRDRLLLIGGQELTPEQLAAFDAALERRAQGTPVSHILGYRDFFNHRFKIGPQVLDPRPETEILVQQALNADFASVLDLGTGSGAILLSLLAARAQAEGLGSDLSTDALGLAAQNARAIGVVARCRFVRSDWFCAIEGRFDLIVSNPPYIAAAEMPGLARELAHEPRMALTDEADGLSAYRAIAAGAAAHLNPGGRLMVEIGPTQASAVCAIFAAAGLENIRVHPDLDGRDRVICGQFPQDRGAKATKARKTA
ncbi:peptide chain release factor N(5)-glutamine methyltransferase [Aquicoccus sp. G2-2]|uniref:peptide chain release factor N(5)-glutamine methyltransferase n=1 Tax=Aquicoccus sp. G2-2 TaxID=3092120 RepID=UPI002AE09A3E|nr:peptide chain release factor N(5)-glutamine methyltransferase [Aquicoccus sp. G2-2]MEA1112844.1 peptide chain release factor N(5)-glutamine methyltransferase [Aquicoccus sp. G2-2]